MMRVEASRVDADDVVEKILQSQDFTPSLLDSSHEVPNNLIRDQVPVPIRDQVPEPVIDLGRL